MLLIRQGAVILCTVTVLLLATSCGDPPEAVDAVTHSVKDIPGTIKTKLPITWDTGKSGGTWYDTYGDDIRSYNPFSSLDGSYITFTTNAFDGLFDYEPTTRQWTGYTFESFKVDSDEAKDTMSLTAKLHDNMRWSDGVPLTAEDITWWYNELESDPDIYPRGATGAFVEMPDGSKKKIVAETLDRLTVRWTFPRVMANPVLMVNSGEVMPKHIWEPVKKLGKKAVMDFWGPATPPEQLVSSGPFVLEKYVPGERIVLKRNPYYWQKDANGTPLPYLEHVILSFVPDANAELLKFQNGELESYTLRGKDIATLLPDAAAKGIVVYNGGPNEGYPALMFNQNPAKLSPAKHKLFNDARFRKAISRLVNRATLVEQVAKNLGEPQYHFISDNNRYFNPARATDAVFDPPKAKALLAEIGLKDINGDGILEDPDGKPLSISFMTSDQDTVNTEILNIIISEMAKVGLKATIDVVQVQSISQRLLYTYDWEGRLASMSFPTFQEQWTNVWPSTGDFHYWFPKQKSPQNPWEQTVDALQYKLRYTYDPVKAKALYDDFQKVMMDELTIIPLYRRYAFMAVRAKWGNVNWDVHRDIGDGLRRVYLK